MARALETQLELKEARELPFEDRLAILIDAEALDKDNSRMSSRIKSANFRLAACMEDLKIKASRGLDRATITALATCDWMRHKRNVAITGIERFLFCKIQSGAARLSGVA